MLYELVNPSDSYIFEVDSFEVAALTVFLISTAYAAKPENGNEEEQVPLFLFGGSKEWYMDTFHRTPDEGLDTLRENVAKALLSFMYGHFEDWHRYKAALAAIDDENKKQKFIEEWQDGHSSMNDIGSYAHKLGEKMMQSIHK